MIIGSGDRSGSIRGSYVSDGDSSRRRVISSSACSKDIRMLSGFTSEPGLFSYDVSYKREPDNLPVCMRLHSR